MRRARPNRPSVEPTVSGPKTICEMRIDRNVYHYLLIASHRIVMRTARVGILTAFAVAALSVLSVRCAAEPPIHGKITNVAIDSLTTLTKDGRRVLSKVDAVRSIAIEVHSAKRQFTNADVATAVTPRTREHQLHVELRAQVESLLLEAGSSRSHSTTAATDLLMIVDIDDGILDETEPTSEPHYAPGRLSRLSQNVATPPASTPYSLQHFVELTSARVGTGEVLEVSQIPWGLAIHVHKDGLLRLSAVWLHVSLYSLGQHFALPPLFARNYQAPREFKYVTALFDKLDGAFQGSSAAWSGATLARELASMHIDPSQLDALVWRISRGKGFDGRYVPPSYFLSHVIIGRSIAALIGVRGNGTSSSLKNLFVSGHVHTGIPIENEFYLHAHHAYLKCWRQEADTGRFGVASASVISAAGSFSGADMTTNLRARVENALRQNRGLNLEEICPRD
jgi:hypothetical protein